MTKENLHSMTFDLLMYAMNITKHMNLTDEQKQNIDAFQEKMIDYITDHDDLKKFTTKGFESIHPDIRMKIINKCDKLYKQYSVE